MQPNYTPLQTQLGTAQLLGALALILLGVHCNDCMGDHAKLVRRQVKAECLRQAD